MEKSKKDKLSKLFIIFIVLFDFDKIKMGKFILAFIFMFYLIWGFFDIYLLIKREKGSLNKCLKNKVDSFALDINTNIVKDKRYYIFRSEIGFIVISVLLIFLSIFRPKDNTYYALPILYILIVLGIFKILSIYIFNSNIKLPQFLKFIKRFAEKNLQQDNISIYVISLVKYSAFVLFLTIASISRLFY